LNTILISFYLVINPLILGFFVETKFIGYFSAIFSIVVPLANLVNIGFVFMPIFTWIQGSRLNRGFNKAVKYLSILSIPAAFGLSFIIISIIRVIYGQEYLPTEYYIPLLVSSILASFLIPAEILNMLIDSIFISKRKVKIITLRLIWATGLLILLDFIFIMLLSRFGAAWIVAGICAATLITRYTVLIISNGLLNKSFNFKLDIKSFLSPLIASLIMLAFLFIFEKLFNPGIGRTIIMVCLAVIVYLISFYLIDNRRNI